MAVVDNNVLSSLAKIERLDLLPSLFGTVTTPPSVIDELERAKVEGYTFVDRIETETSYNDGWLDVATPTTTELETAENLTDHALSTTDARCLALALHRQSRLVTDDRHVGTRAAQRDVEVWDLVVLLQAAIQRGCIETTDELSTVLDTLQAKDGYRFAAEDRNALFDDIPAEE